jgi:2-dehydro-3-deoxy-D-arabinonate dehydratase
VNGQAVWRVKTPDGVRIARGPVALGPTDLLPVGSIAELLSIHGPSLLDMMDIDSCGPIPGGTALLAPVDDQEIWASGVTFERSRVARKEEAATGDVYDRVYAADRPELFFKAPGWRTRGEGAAIGIRSDSVWNVPEPELGLVVDARGALVAYTVGNDVSSRSIEGENPLYLPQAKVFHGSCALGPALVPVECAPPFRELVIHMTVSSDDRKIFEDEVRLSSMRRTPEELVDWLFRAMHFPVGFVLLSGTSMVPPAEFTLKYGDTVRISIPGVGTLTNYVGEVGKNEPYEAVVEQSRGPAMRAGQLRTMSETP